MDAGPQSPFNPFAPSPRSAEFNAARENGTADDDFFFEAHSNLAPMPDVPPPPPPPVVIDTSKGTPPRNYTINAAPMPPPHSSNMNMIGHKNEGDLEDVEEDVEEGVEVAAQQGNKANPNMDIKTDSASTTNNSTGETPSDLPPSAPPSKRTKHKKSRKKDRKKEGKSKGKSKRKQGKSGSYSQYSSIKDKHGHSIVHYESEDGDNAASLFSFCNPKRDGTESGTGSGTGTRSSVAWNNHKQGETIANIPATPKLGNMNLKRRMRGINTGVANSAAGEGTTVPQLLATMRFFTFLLSALTIAFEVWAMFFNVILLKGDKVVLGVYLLFFIGLLLLYEFVRGNPVPASNGIARNIALQVHVPFIGNGSINLNPAQVAELVWTVVLEKRWARQVRYFLQSNFGILYSCAGKGIFLCFVGSVAIGQKFLLIEILGAGFVLFGLWTISLRVRYPALEKAMIMDLEQEFGDCDLSSTGESAVTWSSIHSSIRSTSGEKRSLLSKNGIV